MFKASGQRVLTMLLAAGLTVAVVVGLARATAPNDDVERPTIPARTPLAGANKGGLFADGVTNVPKVDTSAWKVYANTKYGYSFKYPPTWTLVEMDSGGQTGPNGEPAYPLQSVKVENPIAEQGENLLGTNCQDNGCIAPPPSVLGFFVSVLNAQCAVPGDLVASDRVAVGDLDAARCVIQSQFDRVSRFVYLAFPLAGGKDFIQVSLERGRNVLPASQATLETILSTFTIAKGITR